MSKEETDGKGAPGCCEGFDCPPEGFKDAAKGCCGTWGGKWDFASFAGGFNSCCVPKDAKRESGKGC